MTTLEGNALAALASEWVGDERITMTRWGQDEPAIRRVHARFDLGGKALLMDCCRVDDE